MKNNTEKDFFDQKCLSVVRGIISEQFQNTEIYYSFEPTIIFKAMSFEKTSLCSHMNDWILLTRV